MPELLLITAAPQDLQKEAFESIFAPQDVHDLSIVHLIKNELDAPGYLHDYLEI